MMQENMTVKQWRLNFLKISGNSKDKHPGSLMNYAGYVYDAVWVYALAIDKLTKEDPEALSKLHSENTTQ